MSEPIIDVEGLGKCYRIGQASRHPETLGGRIAQLATAPLRNFHNLRRLGRFREGDADQIWAVRDLTFHVKRGEVLGIVGHNGAGKSTLLKVLSRITPPTRGRARIRGRVASLLEVGTGFHPELTGRENIYLNGAVLGMSRREISRKFDDIVSFSEFETFIDTPIKRYSSGMSVRLGFAVAAHLDPQILIIDKILAVGDAAFQRKCIGKMNQIAQQERTILFVSHNLASVRQLCPRSILLQYGEMIADGPTEDVIAAYQSSLAEDPKAQTFSGTGLHISSLEMVSEAGDIIAEAFAGQAVAFLLGYENPEGTESCEADLMIFNDRGVPITRLGTAFCGPRVALGQRGKLRCDIPSLPLPLGRYRVAATLRMYHERHDEQLNALSFDVIGSTFFAHGPQPQAHQFSAMLAHRWDSVSPDLE